MAAATRASQVRPALALHFILASILGAPPRPDGAMKKQRPFESLEGPWVRIRAG